MASFAPEHNRLELEAMEAMDQILGPQAVQVAVLRYRFPCHPAGAAYVYAGPYAWVDQGIRRYGFHGISRNIRPAARPIFWAKTCSLCA